MDKSKKALCNHIIFSGAIQEEAQGIAVPRKHLMAFSTVLCYPTVLKKCSMVNNAQLCEGPFLLNRQCASHTPARAKTRFTKPVKHRAAQLREPHLWCHYLQSRGWCLFLPPKTIIVSRRSQYISTWLDSREKSCRFSCFARCTEPSLLEDVAFGQTQMHSQCIKWILFKESPFHTWPYSFIFYGVAP